MNKNNILFKISKKEVKFNNDLSKSESNKFEEFLILKYNYEKRFQDFFEKRDINSTLSMDCAFLD